jgi:hypothetical protein
MSAWRLSRTVVGAAAVALSACSSTHTAFTSTWQPGNARPVSVHGKQVAVVFINQNASTRRLGEDAMANEVARAGAIPIESYRLMPEKPPELERARKDLERAGADVVVSMRVVGVDQSVSYDPARWSGSPIYGSWWNYWGFGWGGVYSPGYLYTDTVVGIETLVYSLNPDKLLWAGMSETFNPRDVNQAVRHVAEKAVQTMSDEGVLTK